MESPHQSAASTLPQIRGYRLLRVIGHGGMSTVYLAEQESLGRKVAIKVMLPEALADEVSRRRFENEARTIARLDHPHIVGIHEVGRTRDDLPYYAMPHLGRGHLGARIAAHRGQPRDEARIIATLRALLEALDYAHVRGVVHRDVKAENVLFDEADRPLLADFGIALRKGINPRLTMTGLAVGSTAYMPPEQARGEEVDSRADLYSIGVLAWEMLVGELPFNAGDALSMAVMHAKDPIPRLPAELRHWQRFIDRAMAKHPGSRFRSAQQMLEALARIERGGFSLDAVLANTAALWHRLRRLPRPAVLGTLLLLATVAGVAWYRASAPGSEDFFRARIAEETAADLGDPVPLAMQPLPASPAQPWIEAAQRQLEARHLTAPPGDNAYDSVVTAWNADSAHQGLGAVIEAVIDALGIEMASQLRKGDAARARDYLQRATHLANQTTPLGAHAIGTLHTKAAEALSARVVAAEKARDRGDALAAAALANEFAGNQGLTDALRTRADAIPAPAPAAAPAAAAASGSFAVLPPVTRAAYERFADATGRDPALCREKLSVLRLLKPRDWRTVGQGPSGPVVCVSLEDARDYARWASHGRQRYRLPTSAEMTGLERAGGGRDVATWLAEGGIAGGSRRATRSLEAGRGYEDVGFRLVRE